MNFYFLICKSERPARSSNRWEYWRMIKTQRILVSSKTRTLFFVFFNSLELRSSTPDADDNFSFLIISIMPFSVNSMGGMTACKRGGSDSQWVAGSVVKTDENATLNALAHSWSVIIMSLWSVRIIVSGTLGCKICQNFWGLLSNTLGRVSWKKEHFSRLTAKR